MRLQGRKKSFDDFGKNALHLLFLSVFLIGAASAASGFPPGQTVEQPTQPPSGPRSKPLAKSPTSPKESKRKQKSPSILSPLGAGFSASMLPVRLHVSQNGYCFTVAPENWRIYGVGPQGEALDIAAEDLSMAASYSIGGVPGGLARTYPNRYASPEINIHNSLSEGGKSQVSYGQPFRDDNTGYTWLPFEFPEGRFKGVICYRVWPMPGDPGGYIVLMRRAQTAKKLWESQGAQAIVVALSIRCTRQLRATSDGGTRGLSDDDKAESTYNQQLGMEYAHDADTGENYWVSPSTDWRDTGPEGPGYYKRSGNDLKKLAPGRQ